MHYSKMFFVVFQIIFFREAAILSSESSGSDAEQRVSTSKVQYEVKYPFFVAYIAYPNLGEKDASPNLKKSEKLFGLRKLRKNRAKMNNSQC